MALTKTRWYRFHLHPLLTNFFEIDFDKFRLAGGKLFHCFPVSSFWVSETELVQSCRRFKVIDISRKAAPVAGPIYFYIKRISHFHILIANESEMSPTSPTNVCLSDQQLYCICILLPVYSNARAISCHKFEPMSVRRKRKCKFAARAVVA